MAVNIFFVGAVFLVVCFFAFCLLAMGVKFVRLLTGTATGRHRPRQLRTVQCINGRCLALNPAEARFCGRCGQIMHKHGHQPRVTKPLPASA